MILRFSSGVGVEFDDKTAKGKKWNWWQKLFSSMYNLNKKVEKLEKEVK